MASAMIQLVLVFGLILVHRMAAALDDVMHNDLNRFNKTSDAKDEVKIVVYDKVRGYLNWMQDWFQESARERCSTRCTITENKGGLNDADMVMFHAPTHGREGRMLPSSKSKKIGQTFAFLSMEQPKYAQYLSDTKYVT